MVGKENTVIEAEDGEVAIYVARRHKPNLILMDIMMPKMNGYTACKAIKTTPIIQAIPVIMSQPWGMNSTWNFLVERVLTDI